MKTRIIAIGKIKNDILQAACNEYLKRLGNNAAVVEIDAPKGAGPKQESKLIFEKIPARCFIVALDERGETLSSPAFAAKLEKWQAHGEIAFLIGGADGFDDAVRQKADFLLSFGKQTWPHMLVRVMLLEQVYRARQILAGHPYHRG